jgi:hypothetical protein
MKKTAKSSKTIRANKRKAKLRGEASAPASAGDRLILGHPFRRDRRAKVPSTS